MMGLENIYKWSEVTDKHSVKWASTGFDLGFVLPLAFRIIDGSLYCRYYAVGAPTRCQITLSIVLVIFPLSSSQD